MNRATITAVARGVILASTPLFLGCGSTPDQSGNQARTERQHPEEARILRWSIPVHYHGTQMRLELPPGDQEQSAHIERYDLGDRLRAGNLSISHQYERFEVAGAHYRFESGSRVFVFRPPTAETPWESSGDRFALVCIGDGVTPVLREDRPDGAVTWYFGRARVERGVDGTLRYVHRDEDRSFRLPVTLLLGSRGELIDSRPSAG